MHSLAMDTPEILEAILEQLPLNTLLACTLVSQQWHAAARSVIQRSQLAVFEEQLDSLRCFTLNRSTTAHTTNIFHSLPLLINLVSLTVSPDARISPDQINKRTALYDPNEPCLAALLPHLDKLRHLYIHGQDLRSKHNGREGNTQLGGTDAALLSFAASRSTKLLPGLKTLSIISSPDLTDNGLAGYLNTTLSDVQNQSDKSSSTCNSQYTLGSSLAALTLVNCPLIMVQSLQALEENCKNLRQLDLRNVDGFFAGDISNLDPTNSENSPRSEEVFTRFIEQNETLHTFTFSSGLDSLPSDLFSAFNTPRSILQNMNIYSSKAIRARHLMSFPSINRLTISGCSNLGDDLPFECMPRLQEFSFLGRGLSLCSVWKLFKNERIRNVTLDVAGSAYESCICSELDIPLKGESPQSARRPNASFVNESKGNEDQIFPPALENFRNRNILSSTIPSWVIAFFIASSPQSLESISLHGIIAPTCCSFGGSPLFFPSQDPSRTSTSSISGFNYRRLLRTTLCAIPFLRPYTSSSKAIVTHTLEGFANTVLSKLPFRNLQGLLAGLSDRCSFFNTADIDTLDLTLADCPNYNIGGEGPNSDSEIFTDRNPGASEVKDKLFLTSKSRRAPNGTRERSLSTSSGIPTNKKTTKISRRALQRSASELMTAREQAIASCGGKETAQFKLGRRESVERSPDVEEQGDSPGMVSRQSAPLSSSTLNDRANTPSASTKSNINAKQVALVQLLAISTVDDSKCQSASLRGGNEALTSRLNAQQIEWLHSTTQGRILRLEL